MTRQFTRTEFGDGAKIRGTEEKFYKEFLLRPPNFSSVPEFLYRSSAVLRGEVGISR